jgi:MFS family permease
MWVLDETGSATAFASILSISIVPTILLSPFGGVLADRINRRNIMVGLDALSGVAVTVSWVWFGISGGFNIVAIGILMVILSVLGAFETPTVQAALPQMLRGYGETTIRRGLAVVNQVQQLASLLPSFLGGILYSFFGIRTMLIITIICFWITAGLECFIKLDAPRRTTASNEADHELSNGQEERFRPNDAFQDIADTFHFLTREQPQIFKLMLFTTIINFFVIGYSGIAFPYIVRNVLGFNATVYGISDGLAGAAGLLGAIVAGVAAAKLTITHLPGACYAIACAIIPSAIAFLLPVSGTVQLVLTVAAVCGGAFAAAFTGIIASPTIQMRTPEAMTGKVMSFLSSFALCASPIGQMVYGWLCDNVTPFWILFATIIGVGGLTVLFSPVFKHFDEHADRSRR